MLFDVCLAHIPSSMDHDVAGPCVAVESWLEPVETQARAMLSNIGLRSDIPTDAGAMGPGRITEYRDLLPTPTRAMRHPLMVPHRTLLQIQHPESPLRGGPSEVDDSEMGILPPRRHPAGRDRAGMHAERISEDDAAEFGGGAGKCGPHLRGQGSLVPGTPHR